MNYAGRGSRILGQFADGLIAVLPLFFLIFVPNDSGPVAGIIAVACLGWMFFHLMLADGMEGGQSFGKRVAGTRVVHAETGKPCTFGQSFIRNFLLALLGPIDWVFIFGDKRQRLGDMAAGTVVLTAD